MKHLIHINYIQWLKQNASISKDNTLSSISKKLISDLKQSNSIEEVLAVIQPHIPTADPVYGPINFYSQLVTWHQTLTSINRDYSKANQAFKQIKKTRDNTFLLELIEDFLNNPRKQLHIRSLSLLEILCDNQLSDIIDYIIKLEDAPKPINPRKGSFGAVIPLNAMHEACLKMINNLSNKYEETNPLWHKANSLLQSSLIIYQDMQMEEINLEDSEDSDNELQNEGSTCTLL